MGNVVGFDRLGKNPTLDDLMKLVEGERYTGNFVRDDEKYDLYRDRIERANGLIGLLNIDFDDPDDPLDSHFLIIRADIDPMSADDFIGIVKGFDTVSFTRNGDDVDIYLQIKDIYRPE